MQAKKFLKAKGWLEWLSDFNFEGQHRPGHLHKNANGLPWGEQEMAHFEVESKAAWMKSVNTQSLSNESIHAAQSQDPKGC